MIFTAQNSDAAILSNICSTLTQLKDVKILNSLIASLDGIADGAGVNNPLLVDANWNPCSLTYDTLSLPQYQLLTFAQYTTLVTSCTIPLVTVEFYTDAARTVPLFVVNTVSNADMFVVSQGNRLLFTPPQTLINDSGDGMALPTYYVTITEDFDEYRTVVTQKTYSNADNLLFSSVIVSTKKNPAFTTASSTLIIVPGQQKQENLALSDAALGYMLYDYDLYIQLPVFNWAKLSELERVVAGMNANNIVRLALYSDRYRNGKCTFYSADVDGTFVGQMQFLPSPDMLRGVIHIRCAAYTSNTSF